MLIAVLREIQAVGVEVRYTSSGNCLAKLLTQLAVCTAAGHVDEIAFVPLEYGDEKQGEAGVYHIDLDLGSSAAAFTTPCLAEFQLLLPV